MQEPLSYSYPVLPLRDIVVFPHMIVPLFVGREKSVRALEDVMADDKQILLSSQIDPGVDDPATDGMMLIDITEPVLHECRITSRLSFDALPLWVALGRWLDDTFGDEWDSFAAMVSARRDWSIHGLQRPKTATA